MERPAVQYHDRFAWLKIQLLKDKYSKDRERLKVLLYWRVEREPDIDMDKTNDVGSNLTQSFIFSFLRYLVGKGGLTKISGPFGVVYFCFSIYFIEIFPLNENERNIFFIKNIFSEINF